MPGPIGSAYPGNLVMSVFACFCSILSARSAFSAYRRSRGNGTRKPQSREAAIGVSVVAFSISVFAFYAIWVHR